MTAKPTLFLSLFILTGAIFVILLVSVLELESYYFDMNDELEFTLDSETKYMLLVDDMFQGVFYEVETTSNGSTITYPYLPGYRIGYSIIAEIDGGSNFAHIHPYGDNTTVTVNDYDGIGTILLPEGDIHIVIGPNTTQTTDMEDSFHFALIPSRMIVMILFTVFTGIGTIVFLIVYFITHSQSKKRYEENPYGYDENPSEQHQRRDQDLFDMNNDDIFAQYTNNKKQHSDWDNE